MILQRNMKGMQGEGKVYEHNLRKHLFGVVCLFGPPNYLPQMHRDRTLVTIFEFHDFLSMVIDDWTKVAP